MGFEGELGAGVGFLGVGLWHAYVSVKSYKRNGASSGTFSPRFPEGHLRFVEHVIVAVLAVLHMICSLVASLSQNDENGAGVGVVTSLESFGVAAVFLLYAVVSVIVEGSTVLPLPSSIVSLIAIFAFGEEFALFYFAGGGRSTALEAQYYFLLLVPIGVCLLATIMEISCPDAFLPRFARSMALILQGTWFFQMAASLFGTKWMAQGCDLVQDTEGIYTVSCAGMSLMRARALATLQFNLHLALLIVLFLLPMYTFLRKGDPVSTNYERIGDEATDGARDLHLGNGNGNGQELSQSTYLHVLEDEEDELLSRPDFPVTDGFQRIVL